MNDLLTTIGQLSVQQSIELALPLVAWLVSYFLQRLGASPKVNAAIAGLTVILAAVVACVLQGKLTGNVVTDGILILALAETLQVSPILQGVNQFLLTNFGLKPIIAGGGGPRPQHWTLPERVERRQGPQREREFVEPGNPDIHGG